MEPARGSLSEENGLLRQVQSFALLKIMHSNVESQLKLGKIGPASGQVPKHVCVCVLNSRGKKMLCFLLASLTTPSKTHTP